MSITRKEVDAYGTASHQRLPYSVKCARLDYRDVLTGTRWLAAADRRLAEWDARRQ